MESCDICLWCSKSWKLSSVGNRRRYGADSEESFSYFDVSFRKNEPEKRSKGDDYFLRLRALMSCEMFKVIADVIKHEIHRGRVDFFMSKEIMKWCFVKGIKKERDFELGVFREILDEGVLGSDGEEVENVPFVRENGEVLTSDGSSIS